MLLVLLVLLSRVGPLFRPLLLVVTVTFLAYWYVRACFYFGKAAGIAGVAVLGIGCATAGAVQYSHHLKNEAFLRKLKAYDTVRVQRRTVFPSSPIIQVSLEGEITDDDLAEFVSMPEFAEVSSVYIENCKVSDNGLRMIERWPSLDYVCIESSIITDEAILEFEGHHPDCLVIPRGRDW